MASKVDTTDPNVRRMVYNMYRGILGNYNEKANSIVNTLPRHRVTQDQGIDKQLESMIRQSSQISGNGTSNPSPGPPPGAPPPPPPAYATGGIPSVRIPTEMSCRKEPPAAIQNAMMTKDKKPFTYTPGGLDLNEIRSPRMAKRISRNAHLEDSCTGAAVTPPSPPIQPQQLPPQTLAAMQPQIAVAVLPPGTKFPKAQTSPPINPGANGGAAPPPPPMLLNTTASASPMTNSGGEALQATANSGVPAAPPLPNSCPPPPPPLPSAGGPPPPPPPFPGNGGFPPKPVPSEVAAAAAGFASDTMRRNQPRPDYIADIANHAHTLKRVNHPPRSHSSDQQSQNFPQIQLRQTGFHPKMQANDEGATENDETDKIDQTRVKTPSPPKTFPDETSPAEQPVVQPVQENHQAPRPNFQHPLQQSFRQGVTTPTPSPTVGNQPRPFRPQTTPVTPTTPEVQRQKFSPPRTSPPREVFTKMQPQKQPTPTPPPFASPPPFTSPPPFASPPPFSPPPTTAINQPRVFRPQASPVTPDTIGPIYNQIRKSPPKEIVTVFQPQVYQDTGTPSQGERFQGKTRPPGLKMPDVSDPSPRPTPPSSAGLRQAPAPWMSTQRSQSKELPSWASREDSTPSVRSPPPNTIQINARIVPMQLESYQPEQPKQPASNPQGRVHIIPIRLEGSDEIIKPQASQPNK